MRIPRIYMPVSLHIGERIVLDHNAANHIVRVLRLKQGAPLVLFNGQGGEYQATLEQTERNAVIATVKDFAEKNTESPLHITLIQGISRGEKMDYTLQKAVELGVSRFIPVFTERCTVKLEDQRASKRLQHWQAIIASACEQCGRTALPEIIAPIALYEWLALFDVQSQPEMDTLRIVLDPEAKDSLTGKPAQQIIDLLIGPEGGFSEREMEMVYEAGFSGVRLGPRILRTETAGLVALSVLQSQWGDLS